MKKRTFSDVLDCVVDMSVVGFEDTAELTQTEFTDLISMGELVDRLSIVNIKLFNLKSEVMRNQDDAEFLARAPIYDVELCEERSRIKACIDKKLLAMIKGGAEHITEYKSY